MKNSLFIRLSMLAMLAGQYLGAQTIPLDWVEHGISFTNSSHVMRALPDSHGNIVMVGYFSGTLIIGNDTLVSANVPDVDIYIAKYDSTGTELWADSYTSGNYSYIRDIAIDNNDNIYICGSFSNPTLTIGNTVIINTGWACAYAAKFDINGNIVWARTFDAGISPSNSNEVKGITVDNAGNIYVTGCFASDTLKTGNLSVNFKYGPGGTGITNVFVAKLLNNGTPVWLKGETQGSNPGGNEGRIITTDNNGNVYVGGVITGLWILLDTITLHVSQFQEGFCAMLDPLTGNYIWARVIKGFPSAIVSTYEEVTGLMTDDYGNLYVGGNYAGVVCTFDSLVEVTSPVNPQNPDGYKIFLFKVNAATGLPYWGRGYGDLANTDVFTSGRWGINDAGTHIGLTGAYQGAATFGSIQFPIAQNFSFDAFLLEMDSAGTIFRGLPISGDPWEVGFGVAYDHFDKMITCGYFNGPSVSFGNQFTLFDTSPANMWRNIYLARFADAAPTAVNTINAEIPFTFYPNPASSEITLKRNTKSKCTIRIYDDHGRVVHEIKNSDASGTILIDVSGLATGHYIIECTDETTVFHKSFIKL
ncbi:MAG: T9SS type A sorting domain-containing protein [Bacteroidia bacterium]